MPWREEEFFPEMLTVDWVRGRNWALERGLFNLEVLGWLWFGWGGRLLYCVVCLEIHSWHRIQRLLVVANHICLDDRRIRCGISEPGVRVVVRRQDYIEDDLSRRSRE